MLSQSRILPCGPFDWPRQNISRPRCRRRDSPCRCIIPAEDAVESSCVLLQRALRRAQLGASAAALAHHSCALSRRREHEARRRTASAFFSSDVEVVDLCLRRRAAIRHQMPTLEERRRRSKRPVELRLYGAQGGFLKSWRSPPAPPPRRNGQSCPIPFLSRFWPTSPLRVRQSRACPWE